jgi:hypothetical protein
MELTPRDKRTLLIAGIALPLLVIVSFLVLGPDGGEDLALPTGPPGATGTTGVATAPPTLSPSPTPRETLPPVSLAGSRDPFAIPAGLELSTGGSVSPTTTASSGGTTTAATTIPTTITTTLPTTIPIVPTTTATTAPPPPDDGDGDRPGNKILIGGHNVKLVSVAGNGKKLDVQVDGKGLHGRTRCDLRRQLRAHEDRRKVCQVPVRRSELRALRDVGGSRASGERAGGER